MDLDKPSWSILKLPNETLIRIVEMCDMQDKRSLERLDRLQRAYRDEEIDAMWDPQGRRSLLALSETCKRFRTISCPLLFSVRNLKISKHDREEADMMCSRLR